jgi:hypothetical protein
MIMEIRKHQKLSKRGLDNKDSILNDPIYSGQICVIPKDQLEEAAAGFQDYCKMAKI